MNPFFLLFLSLALAGNTPGRVRKVTVKPDQVVTVRTALGVATIIQVPDRPNSLVVGDTEAYKVEYLDQAITIKPVQVGAKSNLYIYTDYRRYNVELRAGPEAKADYVVYLLNPPHPEAEASARWKSFRKISKGSPLVLESLRIGTDGTACLAEFSVESERPEKISPAAFWLTQRGKSRPIDQLSLSSLEAGPSAPVTGSVRVLKKDLLPSEPVRLELRQKKNSFIELPEVFKWK